MKNIFISQVDSIFANGSYPIEFLLFFKNRIKTKSIRISLKYLADTFWPVFGTYDSGKITSRNYNPDLFYQEISHNKTFNPKTASSELINEFRTVLPEQGGPLFLLTLIQYLNGTVMIARMNHLAGDGYSYFYFMSTLAAISRSRAIPLQKNLIRILYKPHHHRTLLKDFRPDHIPEAPQNVHDISKIEYLKYTKGEISDIITEDKGHDGKQLSANDVLSALFLKKVVEGHSDIFQNNIQISIPIDVRRNIKELGIKFFGNGLYFHSICLPAAEISESETRQVARQIRNSIPDITGDFYIDYLTNLESDIKHEKTENLVPYNPDKGCLVTNLSRLPLNKLNFGTGTPELLFPLTIAKNAAVILADNNFHVLRVAL